MKFRMRGSWIVVSILILLGSGYSSALESHGMRDESVTPKIQQSQMGSLEEYLQMAAWHNPEIKRRYALWKAASAAIPISSAFPDPKFSYGHYLREIETRTGPQQNKFGISQTLPWFGKRSVRKNGAEARAMAAYQQFKSAELNLFYRVKSVYIDLYYLKKSIDITQHNIVLLKKLEGVAQAKVRAGSDLSSVIKAQTEIAKLEERLLSLSDRKRPIVAQLNALIGTPGTQDHPWPQSLPVSQISPEDVEMLAAQIPESPAIQALRHSVDSADLRVKQAELDYYPDVTIGLDYIETGDAMIPSSPGSGKDPVIASISFSIPVWREKLRSGTREAKHKKLAAQYQMENQMNQLTAQLEMAINHFRDARRKIELYQSTLMPLATNSLRVTQESYKSGKSGFLDLIDAQRLLLEFQLSLEKARSDATKFEAEIAMITGDSSNQ